MTRAVTVHPVKRISCFQHVGGTKSVHPTHCSFLFIKPQGVKLCCGQVQNYRSRTESWSKHTLGHGQKSSWQDWIRVMLLNPGSIFELLDKLKKFWCPCFIQSELLKWSLDIGVQPGKRVMWVTKIETIFHVWLYLILLNWIELLWDPHRAHAYSNDGGSFSVWLGVWGLPCWELGKG